MPERPALLDAHVWDWKQAEAARRMAIVDAWPEPARLALRDHAPPIVHVGLLQFGGNAPVLGLWLRRQQRERQADLLRQVSSVGAALAKRMKR